MRFLPTPLNDVYLIEPELREDERGFFYRAFCQREFSDQKLDAQIVQINNSYSAKRGTLRGLHHQIASSAETKVVRCLTGSIFDVVVDLRPNSPSFLKWYGAELNSTNRKMMYVPQGFAHGFMTLDDDSEILYMVSASYDPVHERGIRWNDPAIGITWPLEPTVISERDRQHPNIQVQATELDIV